MPPLRELPTDIASFELMIEGNCLYVDKTQHIYQLYKGTKRYYFLSRPRRFGKTLLISTLKELFSGNKKLFKDLWIGLEGDWKWQEHPVIHLDLSLIAHETDVELRTSLVRRLEKIGQSYGIDLSQDQTLADKMSELIEQLAKKNKVVLLVDEYDKPLLDHITNIEMASKNRAVLQSLFAVIKGLDSCFRAIFITGVTKFSRVSIFSGLNNLNDISEKPEAATLLGYTQTELETNFDQYITMVASQYKTDNKTVLKNMKHWYNGYRFSVLEEFVYNPFSTLYYLNDRELRNYWFTSGTPSFLVALLKKRYQNIENVIGKTLSIDDLGPFDINNIPIIPILYQAGYLTIRNVFRDADERLMLTIDYPNAEVKESLSKYLFIEYAHTDSSTVNASINSIKAALSNNDIESFCLILRTLFANIPYNLHIPQESYYHSLFQLMGNLLGLDVQSEAPTSKGKLDLALITAQRIFVFEFKFNKTSEEALEQVHEKRYYEKYLTAGRPITLAGISFNYEGKQLVLDWKSEVLGKE